MLLLLHKSAFLCESLRAEFEKVCGIKTIITVLLSPECCATQTANICHLKNRLKYIQVFAKREALEA